MTQIEVVAPTNFSWYPGQHVFLRFPKVNMFDNHPFTITSTSPAATSQQQESAKLVFLARTHNGFTRRLAAYSKTSQADLVNAWVDGPYGGITVPVHNLFDNVICTAGGTGLTPCLGLLADLVSKHAASPTTCRFKTIKFIWVFRELRHFAWAGERFVSAAAVAQSASGLAIEFRFYLTGNKSSNLTTSAKNEKLANETETGAAVHHEYTPPQIELLGGLTSGRPQLSTLVPSLLTEGKNFVLGCGPQSFRDDLSQSCAALQAKAMRGTIEEISLHTEAFL
jgi:ferredoxin-NADP reductase